MNNEFIKNEWDMDEKYRLVKSGTSIFSISMQESIKFDRDVIVEITGREGIIFNGDNLIFCKLKMLLFNVPNQIPCLVDKGVSQEFDIKYSYTLPYKVPEPQFFKYTYGK